MRRQRIKELTLNPFEVAFALVSTVIGLGLVLSGFTMQVSKVQALPPSLVAVWSLALLLSGPAIMVGLLWDGLIGRAIERAGLYLSMSAWSTYALTLAVIAPHTALIPVLQAICITVACGVRSYLLSKVDRVLVCIAQVAGEDQGG